MSATLVLHKGAREVSLDELQQVPTPPSTATHYPIPFSKTLDITLSNLRDAGFLVQKQRLALLREERFFATFDLASELVPGTTLAVAIRSSHDSSLSYGFVAGNRTFCCDNLALSSDMSIYVRRKHTKRGEDCFRDAMARVIREKLPQFHEAETKRLQIMQTTALDDGDAESLLLRAYQDQKVLSPINLPTALAEWRKPSFPGLEDKTVWRLYSALTYALGPRAKSNPQAHATACLKLGKLLALPEAPAIAA